MVGILALHARGTKPAPQFEEYALFVRAGPADLAEAFSVHEVRPVGFRDVARTLQERWRSKAGSLPYCRRLTTEKQLSEGFCRPGNAQ